MSTFIFQPRPVPKYRPRTPAGPANVVAASPANDGLHVILEFDRPVTLNPPPHLIDDAVRVNGVSPIALLQPAGNKIALVFAQPLPPGSAWTIQRPVVWCRMVLAAGSGTVALPSPQG